MEQFAAQSQARRTRLGLPLPLLPGNWQRPRGSHAWQAMGRDGKPWAATQLACEATLNPPTHARSEVGGRPVGWPTTAETTPRSRQAATGRFAVPYAGLGCSLGLAGGTGAAITAQRRSRNGGVNR